MKSRRCSVKESERRIPGHYMLTQGCLVRRLLARCLQKCFEYLVLV